MLPYGPAIVRAARITFASSTSLKIRSRATSRAGSGTPSAGDLSKIARPPHHQPRKVLIDFSCLIGGSRGSALIHSWRPVQQHLAC